MQYHAQTKTLVIDLDTLENVSSLIWCALQQMRKALDLPLEPYKQTGGLKPIDYAGKDLLDAAKALGLDMGATWQSQLDLRDKV